MVVGESRPYLAAVIVLNAARWREAAARLGLDPDSAADLGSDAAAGWALSGIRHAARALPSYATPRAALLTTEAWTIENALMTPTLKPKRLAIAARYAQQIEQLYAGHGTARA